MLKATSTCSTCKYHRPQTPTHRENMNVEQGEGPLSRRGEPGGRNTHAPDTPQHQRRERSRRGGPDNERERERAKDTTSLLFLSSSFPPLVSSSPPVAHGAAALAPAPIVTCAYRYVPTATLIYKSIPAPALRRAAGPWSCGPRWWRARRRCRAASGRSSARTAGRAPSCAPAASWTRRSAG